MTDEGGTPIKAASIEPEIGATHLLSSYPKEESKLLGYLDAATATVPSAAPDPPTGPNPPTQPLDRILPGLHGRNLGTLLRKINTSFFAVLR